jgi:hypothetical protein
LVSVRISRRCVHVMVLEVPVMAGVVGRVEFGHSLQVLFNSVVLVCI